MTSDSYIKLGKNTAIISFLIGTFLFLVFAFGLTTEILILGYAFTIMALVINLGVLFLILIESIRYKENRNKLLRTCGFMLINIPIIFLYLFLIMILIDIIRISVVNPTKNELTNIKISGCQEKHIDKLQSGESETVWIEINNDCTINIEYTVGGIIKQENVMDYVTTGMGQKIVHTIGVKKEY